MFGHRTNSTWRRGHSWPRTALGFGEHKEPLDVRISQLFTQPGLRTDPSDGVGSRPLIQALNYQMHVTKCGSCDHNRGLNDSS
jgi:hypothetical protein